MRLYVETMDSVLEDFSADGRVKLEQAAWETPTLQERRAIIHAASEEIARLEELIAALEPKPAGRAGGE